MDNQGLISVIIPVYNVEQYLCECIDSVLNQTYSSYEIILVDDGSTDSSGKICDEYAEKSEKIKVIHKENGGQSSARNLGLKSAGGKYIYFLDSDDYLAENAFEELVKHIEQENSDFVFFDAVSFSDPEDNFKIKQSYIRKNQYKTDKGINILSKQYENKEYHCVVYLLLFKKEFLDNAQLFFCEGMVYEDEVFSFQAFCEAKKVSQLPQALYFRRYRTNSTMTSIKSKHHFKSCKAVCIEIAKYVDRNQLAQFPVSNISIVRFAFNTFNNYDKLNKNDKKDCKDELNEFKKYLFENNFFSNTSLRMRCYGKTAWAIQKIFEKISKIIFRR